MTSCVLRSSSRTVCTPKPMPTKMKATRLSIPERIFVATQNELYESPSMVQKKYVERFKRDPPSRLTIYRIHDKFIRTGSVADCIKGVSGRRITKRTNENIAKVRSFVKNSKYPSTRRIALAFGMSNYTAQKILRQDLEMHPYVIQRCQKLKDQDKVKRVEACRIILAHSYLEPDMPDRIMFSDEATFHTSGFVNKKTCIIWGEKKPDEAQEYLRNSPKVNVWCAVSSLGIIGPYFHEGDSVNGAMYLDLLENYLLENMPLSLRQTGYFQQDGATAHYTLPVRNFLDKHFKDRWIGRAGPIPWPPYSPDLTVCDFWLWGYVKTRVYSEPIKNLTHLKARITQVINDIPVEMCRSAVYSSFDRFELCLQVGGDQTEKYR